MDCVDARVRDAVREGMHRTEQEREERRRVDSTMKGLTAPIRYRVPVAKGGHATLLTNDMSITLCIGG